MLLGSTTPIFERNLDCALEKRPSHQPHKLEIVGSSPTGATIFMNKRYACEGTLLYHASDKAFGIVVYSTLGGGGAPFKTIAHASRYNSHNTFSFMETNESPELYGWELADDSTLVLYGTQDIIDRVEKLKALVRLGYRGQHQTKKELMDELEWRML